MKNERGRKEESFSSVCLFVCLRLLFLFVFCPTPYGYLYCCYILILVSSLSLSSLLILPGYHTSIIPVSEFTRWED